MTHLSLVVVVARQTAEQQLEECRENLAQSLGRVSHDHLVRERETHVTSCGVKQSVTSHYR